MVALENKFTYKTKASYFWAFCPYCGDMVGGEKLSLSSEGYKIIKCEECGRKFYLTEDRNYKHPCLTFIVIPNCSLNNKEHTPTIPSVFEGAKFCKDCGLLIKDLKQ